MYKGMKLIDEACQSDILRGYSESHDGYRCLICEQDFTKGEIYQLDEKLFDAHKAILIHIKEKHGSVLDALLKSPSNSVGISELQLGLLTLFAAGLSDKQISQQLGVASSTIRNHRYKLREKEKQAKLFLSVMQLLEEKQGNNTKVNKEHKEDKNTNYKEVNYKESNYKDVQYKNLSDNNMTYNDVQTKNIKQYNRTMQEVDTKGYKNIHDEEYSQKSIDSSMEESKILKQCINEHGRIRRYPQNNIEKNIILRYIIKQFKKGKMYMDSEINTTLMSMYVDYEVIKKELLENGLLCRSDKGGVYWVKGA